MRDVRDLSLTERYGARGEHNIGLAESSATTAARLITRQPQ
jgi:hypothetical protein